MIDRREAEEIAAEWARRESLRLGHEHVPVLDEFDLGYVVWSKPTQPVITPPGSGPLTVIDKATGETTSWPHVPPPVVQEMYRRGRAERPPAPRTVDPAAQLLRNTRRIPTPGAAAHLTLRGELRIGHGAKGDLELNHHRLVRDFLAALPPGHLVRGGDRHAELIVVSDVLHEYDQRREAAGRPPLSLDEARQLLSAAHLEVFRVREPGDPAGGPVEVPCESCIAALVHLHLLPWDWLGYTAPRQPEPQPVPEPDRFPPEVAFALVDGGWRPRFGAEVYAAEYVNEVCAVPGRQHRHESFPAAKQTLTAFPALVTTRYGLGEQVRIRPVDIDPPRAAHSADSLADLGAVIGVRLFPIGSEDDDSILAVDEHGRIFALDQGGEWFIGADIDQALTNLLLGRAPARIRDDGTW